MTDMLTWLRATIENAKAAAEAVRQPDGSPTIAPWTGYAHPPGMGSRYQDRDVILVGAEPESGGESWLVCEVGQWPGARAVADHIALHDPQDTIARCDAELAELAAIEAIPHERVHDDEWFSCSQARDEHGDLSCYDDDRNGKPCDCGRDALVDHLIRVKAYGRRHRPDWNPDWTPGGTSR